ncbi:MAG: hypothetical protein EOP35_19090 [Rubrivivax sp.]|nr:MAG: hypothetical protein EOP35_19090 [Rubrivivax sp.]
MKRRHLLSLSAAALMPATATPSIPPRFLHVGTYAPSGQGIYRFTIAADGTMEPLGVTLSTGSPSWLLADAARQRVYAAEEGANHVAVYRHDGEGTLTLLQREPSGGHSPCHLSLGAGRLWAAHYADARFAALAVQPDGRLAPAHSWPSCSGSIVPSAAMVKR